jgi:hypothetical protein
MCTNFAGYLVTSGRNANAKGYTEEELAFIDTSQEMESELIVFEAKPGVTGYVGTRRSEQKNTEQLKKEYRTTLSYDFSTQRLQTGAM